ncbi:MAG: DUF1653 domain-containing protein [Candidatus Babeliales bacterium]|nr:DUF1653 domain-containing protein [Candidatus Babeliales bacterium]
MHRNKLIEMLQNYNPVAQEEMEFKERMLNFVKENENCFERTLEQGHITASIWLLNKDNSKALLMHHSKLDQWFQLGGHCDGDSDVLAVAIKEAQEESCIVNIVAARNDIFDIDIHLIPENKKEKAHYHYDIRFLLQVSSDEDVVQNSESKELRWIDKNINNLPTQNRSIVRMFNKWTNLIFPVKVGEIYKHYKGKSYKIISVARNTENIEEVLVVYQAMYNCPTFGANPIWARPIGMFTENVFKDGKDQPRFQKISN